MKFENKIIQGNSSNVLADMPEGIVDLAITDPPYGVRYRDRNGRTVRNDDQLSSVLPVFKELYRCMKPDSICVSFYGWNAIDQFMQAWKNAGFKVGGHMVWTKDYSSRQRYLKYHHEQAYVLLKGNPVKPAEPLTDVQPWAWTGNKAHPTEKSVKIIQPLVRAFSKPGDLVCDPFAGSGSTAVAAALSGRRYLGVELEEQYCTHARNRLAGVQRYLRDANKLAA